MAPPSSTRAAAEEGSDAALDCSVCFLALKAPPAFQCDAGHVICTSCGDNMPAGRCRACRAVAAAGGGYRRGHSRDGWSSYQDRRAQFRRVAPSRCPAEACGFAGSTTSLVGHFATAHGWPCTTGVLSGEGCDVLLHDGINVVAVDRKDDDDNDDDDDDLQKAATQQSRYLLVLNVARESLGRAVSAFLIRPRTSADEPRPSFWAPRPSKPVQCQVSLSYWRYVPSSRGLVRCYFQRTNADVGCTDLNDSLPDPDECFKTTVQDEDDDDEDTVEVTIRVTIYQQ